MCEPRNFEPDIDANKIFYVPPMDDANVEQTCRFRTISDVTLIR